MLPDVSTPETIGRISGVGVGVGYLGSVLAWAIGVILLDRFGYPVVFRTIAICFLVFALPTFFFVVWLWLNSRAIPRVCWMICMAVFSS